MQRIPILALAVAAFLLLSGFNLEHSLVPREEILSGGPPKDGIPALLDPKFVAAGEADFVAPEDEVIGVVLEGRARAFPVKILNWHEVVNSEVAGKPYAVTF